ncbi:cyclopropane-fatty-acyl-phospholipid synthase family protein [Aminobacter sp. J44]|uniref:SAM-dependent methyltransferase n=1 Tax=Aminobacter sp. J44 TaxID=935262 RepID=UPI00119A5219|nr:cyclopropane-fatty-acyl-phospholipid synthase family protein [Aminobacter sp. J44]TWG67614.1 cyclopropane-fatty-acyl-phospholipid synthase [Aminobacter sp. J44]
MNRLLHGVVERLVRTGNLSLTYPDGTTEHFGDGTGQRIHVAIKTKHAQRAILFDPWLAVPEAYMEGELEILEGDVLSFLKIAYENMGPWSYGNAWAKALESVRVALRRFHQINTAHRSRKNVEHHYDLSREFYRLFLDEDMQYSCAYFERPDMTLEEAQLAKKRHLAAKLDLKPGQQVLDIGSGWGGLGLYLAQNFDVDVLGVTLSTEQHAVATDRAHDLGLDRHVHFELRDYRSLQERFDRIVSVGMFEHVGVNHYRTFFEKCASLLKPDGVMVLHSIGRAGPPAATNAFIRKHIFPGGYIPALSEVLPHIEKAGLFVTDTEILRIHYAETLRHWRERFMANRDKVLEIYDERFARMWEFYLAGSEAAFRWQDMMVFQLQLSPRNDTLPLTRDYITLAEKEIAKRDSPAASRGAPAAASSAKRKKVTGKG